MTETGRCGLAKYAARGKQYLVVVRPVTGHEGGLMMQQLNYADEIRSFTDVEVPEAEVKDAELKLAIMLTDQIATDEFHPENYKDEVKERIEGLIQKKIAGQEISESKTEAPKTQVIDLMEALKASLAARGGRGGRQKEAASAPAKPERKPAMRATRARSRPRSPGCARSGTERRTAKGYSASNVASLLGVSVAQVRAWAEVLEIEREPDGSYRFRFRDLVLLRTAKGLAEARVPAATVRRALKKLRGQLPEGRPLTGVRIAADGKRVVVQDGATVWNPESGQTLFDFAVADLATAAAPHAKRAAEAPARKAEKLSADGLVPSRVRRRGVLPRRRARRLPARRRARAAPRGRAREPRTAPPRARQDGRGRGALPHRAHVEPEARRRRVQPRRRPRGPRAPASRPYRPTSARSRRTRAWPTPTTTRPSSTREPETRPRRSGTSRPAETWPNTADRSWPGRKEAGRSAGEVNEWTARNFNPSSKSCGALRRASGS